MWARDVVSEWWRWAALTGGWFLLEVIYGRLIGGAETPRVDGMLSGIIVIGAWAVCVAGWKLLVERMPTSRANGASVGGLVLLLVLRMVVADLPTWLIAASVLGVLLGTLVVLQRLSTGFPVFLTALLGTMSPTWFRMLKEGTGVDSAVVNAAVVIGVAGGIMAVGHVAARRWFGRFRRRTWITITTAFGIVLLGIGLWSDATDLSLPDSWLTARVENPNIIMISVDTLRQDKVPPYGKGGPATPAFDTLAEDSFLYTNMFSTSGWTLPAHASLFTGVLPVRHGAVFRELRIDSGLPFYTDILREAGYQTAAFTDGGYLHPEYGFDRGFETFRYYPFESDTAPDEADFFFTPGPVRMGRFLTPSEWWNRCSSDRGGHGVALRTFPRKRRYFGRIVDRTRRWMVKRDTCRPFYLFLHTFQVHDWDRRWGWGYPDNRRRLREEHPEIARTIFKPESLEPPPPWERRLPPGVKRRARHRIRNLDVEDPEDVLRRLEGMESDTRAVLYRWLSLHSDTPWRNFLGKILTAQHSLPPLPYPSYESRRVKYTTLRKWLYAWGDGSRYFDPFRTDPWQSLSRLEDLSRPETERLRALTQRQLQGYELLYDYGIEDVDRELGRLLQFLKDRGLYRKTMIVLLSDHGEGFSQDPLVIRHGNPANRGVGQLHDVLLEVPFWIKPPEGLKAPQTVSRTLQMTDVFPLLFRWLDLPREDLRVGRRFRPPSSERIRRGREWVWGSTVEGRTWKNLFPQTIRLFVRGAGYKLLARPGVQGASRQEIWRVSPEDPSGEVLVESAEVDPDVRARLNEQMKSYIRYYRSNPDPLDPSRASSLPTKLQNQLRGLGYVDHF